MADEPQVNKLGRKPQPGSQSPGQKKSVFPAPPPAEPIPGITGNPPLPVGEPVATATPTAHRPVGEDDYTNEELRTLKSIPGWKPGMPIPENLAEVLHQVSQSARSEALDPDNLQPPVSPDTPPLKRPAPLDISQLPHDKQQEVRQFLEQTAAREQAAADEAARNIPGAGPGVNDMITGAGIKHISLEDDTQSENYAGTDVPKSGFAPQTEATPEADPAPSRTGAGPQVLTDCPHCGWRLSERDTIEVSDADKQRFMQAAIGGLAFEKMYSLLNGQLQVIFRELSPLEVDKCYQEVYYMRNNGEINNPQEFMEVLTRFRLCLQLKLVRSDAMCHEFPSSYDEWEVDEGKSGTKLAAISEQVFTEVLKRESLLRMLSQRLGNFNRVLAKLEANAQNPDFYKETESET